MDAEARYAGGEAGGTAAVGSQVVAAESAGRGRRREGGLVAVGGIVAGRYFALLIWLDQVPGRISFRPAQLSDEALAAPQVVVQGRPTSGWRLISGKLPFDVPAVHG